VLPEVALSAPIPARKWSTVLPTASIGIRVFGVQVCPSVDVLITMSFDEQPERNWQSCQTTYTFPAPSTSAEGSGGSRMPTTLRIVWLATKTVFPQVVPPSVDRKA
jgi:hypothetical protein